MRIARQAVDTNGRFTVALAGGSTPKAMYALLATDAVLRAALPVERMHFFWGDERPVPPDHADSNFRMAHDAMLARLPLGEQQVHRISGELARADRAARDYERRLREFFALSPGQYPRFDLVLLGLGPDGHCASLFPGTRALRARGRSAVSNWVGKLDAERITLTPLALNNAAHVVFLVCGVDKAVALKAVLEGRHEPQQLPAQLIAPRDGTLTWFADRAAAHLLSGRG